MSPPHLRVYIAQSKGDLDRFSETLCSPVAVLSFGQGEIQHIMLNLALQLSCVFFCNVGSYHFVGAYAGATACLRGHSGSLRGQKLKEICLRGLRACGFVQEVPTRLQSRRFF